jgi:hypothetical protein
LLQPPGDFTALVAIGGGGGAPAHGGGEAHSHAGGD